MNEEKIEISCDLSMAKKAIGKIRENHPYEELAIDIILLIDEADL